jgi:uroporphyrinogen decarboxylase
VVEITRVTPREIIRAAIQFQPYEGPVPHIELEFQLSDEMFGEHTLWWQDYQALAPNARRDALVKNVKLWVRIAGRFGYNIIPGFHWLPIEAQLESFAILRELTGDRLMIGSNQDGTQEIPDGAHMMELSFRMADDEDALLAELDDRCNRTIENIRTLAAGGAEIFFMCSDYCFNSGPFLSPKMFRKFVTPFLKRQVEAIHEAGAFAVKHTDGNLWPIMDQLLECHPDGLHSIDPMAGMDIRKVRETVGDTTCLFGNVDCSRLQSGSAEEIEASARYCLEHGPLNGTGYVFASSNCIFKGVPEEAYLGMLAVRDAWEAEARG